MRQFHFGNFEANEANEAISTTARINLSKILDLTPPGSDRLDSKIDEPIFN